uniref:Uncharacterized protein n=1 Tax=Cyanistes caeruleus TaxID=156563 RepID=A0A8C0U348_CYACU
SLFFHFLFLVCSFITLLSAHCDCTKSEFQGLCINFFCHLHIWLDFKYKWKVLSTFICFTGNYRSALNDAIQAKKLKPTHLKAIIRGALCHMELKNFLEAIEWCEEGLDIDPKEKKFVEMRAKADKLKVNMRAASSAVLVSLGSLEGELSIK